MKSRNFRRFYSEFRETNRQEPETGTKREKGKREHLEVNAFSLHMNFSLSPCPFPFPFPFPFLGLIAECGVCLSTLTFFIKITTSWPRSDARLLRTGYKVLSSGLQDYELGSCRSLFQNEGRRFHGGVASFAPGTRFSEYPTKNKSVLEIDAIDYCKVK
jgi:hypothetical protein